MLQQNIADILTKPLSPQSYYHILKWILFKRDSYDNQGELQEIEGYDAGFSDSQALSLQELQVKED